MCCMRVYINSVACVLCVSHHLMCLIALPLTLVNLCRDLQTFVTATIIHTCLASHPRCPTHTAPTHTAPTIPPHHISKTFLPQTPPSHIQNIPPTIRPHHTSRTSSLAYPMMRHNTSLPSLWLRWRGTCSCCLLGMRLNWENRCEGGCVCMYECEGV